MKVAHVVHAQNSRKRISGGLKAARNNKKTGVTARVNSCPDAEYAGAELSVAQAGCANLDAFSVTLFNLTGA